MPTYFDELEVRDPSAREQSMLQQVSAQIAHAKTNTSAYARLLADIDPTSITTAKALAQLPLTRKSSLIQLQTTEPPFGGFAAVSGQELTHIFASPGPIYEPGSRRRDFWRTARALHAAGCRTGHRVHNSFSYHLTPAGIMLESGAHALGAAVIPAGVGQTELQVQTIANLKPQGYVGTPSFLRILLEKAAELKQNINSLRYGLVSGEALPASLREQFTACQIEVLQCYATADLGLIAYETSASEGLVIDEGVYVEIVRPGTGEPVPEGEVGEVVVTTLNPDYPLIRFATGDLSAIMPGQSPCGRTNRRLRGWLGRADQTAKVRGMFIHPSQIAQVLKRHPEIHKARMVVDWREQADQLELHCELLPEHTQQADLLAAIANTVRDLCKLRCDIKAVPIASLANDGVVISDVRKYD